MRLMVDRCLQAGRDDEAEQWIRRIARDDRTDSMVELAIDLLQSEQDGRIEDRFRQAAQDGDRDAMAILGYLLLTWGKIRQQAREDEAEQWLRRAAEAGAVRAMWDLGEFLIESGQDEEGRFWLQRFAEDG
jgi:TPR repeat protein